MLGSFVLRLLSINLTCLNENCLQYLFLAIYCTCVCYVLHTENLAKLLKSKLSEYFSSNKDHYNFSTVHLDASSLHSVFNLVPGPTCSIVDCESFSTYD